MNLVFDVRGVPTPQGSKRAFVRGGRAIMLDDNDRTIPWRHEVAAAASAAAKAAFLGEAPRVFEPIELEVVFRFARPKKHHRTGRHAAELRDDAPAFVSQKPDVDKLLRAVLDALTGVLWLDDAQVVSVTAEKRYCRLGEPPGAQIEVESMDPSGIAKLPPVTWKGAPLRP